MTATRVAYVAQQPMDVSVNGKTVKVLPGEEIPGFAEWDDEPRLSNLSLGYVTAETVTATKDKPAPKRTKRAPAKPAAKKKTPTRKPAPKEPVAAGSQQQRSRR
jgi:hypothetical protein